MRRFLLFSIAAVLALPAYPAARLTYQVNGAPTQVSWGEGAFPLQYLVDRRVISARPGMEELLSRAFGEWTAARGANVTFHESGVADGVKAGKDGQNSITVVDDLFRDQHYLAVTTNWYDDSGRMTEADIQIDNTTLVGQYDLQQLVAHEIGHFLGLDHSAVLSSVMYPFVGKTSAGSLDSDDVIAIADLYPKGQSNDGGATIEGRVIGDAGPVFAAQVVALNSIGAAVATALTDQQGVFSIDGMPPGTYRIYAEPLDGPVDVQNLSGFWRTAKVKSFPTAFAEGAITVQSGKVYGNLVVNTSEVVQKLNPKWIGVVSAGGSDVSLSSAPVYVKPGDTVMIAIGGDGFTSGMTTFEITGAGIHRLTDFSYAGNYVSATYHIDAEAVPGSAVVLVKSGNEQAALTGALRVTPRIRQRVAER